MEAKIELLDEVNAKIHGLNVGTRNRLKEKFSFVLPHARHVPAFKMGRWDGKVSFFQIGGTTYINLLEEILPELLDEGYEVTVQDNRDHFKFEFPEISTDHFSDRTWPKKHTAAGQPIVLRDYQCDIINKFLKNTSSVQEVATGAGKTVITAALSDLVEKGLSQNDKVMNAIVTGNQGARTIVIVPNKSLVTQTEKDYVNLGLDVGVYYGDRKDQHKMHTICTWQSLESMDKRHRDGLSELSLEEFSEGVGAVIVDEAHMAKADVLKKLLTGPFANVPIRWGLTGTIPREEHAAMGIIAGIGPLVGELNAKTLQDDGVLSNCFINILQMQDNVHYDNYQSELTYLTTDKRRLEYIGEIIEKISETGNTLVLVDRVKAGKSLLDMFPDDKAVFISGSVKNAERETHYQHISDNDNHIIVATFGVAAVGINVPRIFNLVLLEPGKSFVRVIQSIGRGLRKADDKDFVNIYDFTSSAKFSKRHLTQRKKFYKESGYPFEVTKIDWKQDKLNKRLFDSKNKKV